jgi:hypothetical protein
MFPSDNESNSNNAALNPSCWIGTSLNITIRTALGLIADVGIGGPVYGLMLRWEMYHPEYCDGQGDMDLKSERFIFSFQTVDMSKAQ